MDQDVQIKNSEKFAKIIIEFANKNRLDLIEALVCYCEDHELEMEDVIQLLDKSMKERIRVDAIQCRYVLKQPKVKPLPI